MPHRAKLLDLSYPPRGLRLLEAARYLGFGQTKFLELVADGRMPKPKRIDGVVVWDRLQLDTAFVDLPGDGSPSPFDTSWEDVA